ncbi:MAG TPA: YetF domain-containing protein [Mycobacterium sp.]|nr:YetF domain-containing protein [Mycobacterium sp.]
MRTHWSTTGNWQSAVYVALKTLALFLTAALAFRFLQRRDRPIHLFDWLTAIVAGSVIGRAATATDTSWIGGVAALLTVIAANAAVTRLRFVPGLRAVIDPPLRVLIRDGKVDHRNLRRCGITAGDLDAILRQHGCLNTADIELALFERTGSVSIMKSSTAMSTGPTGDSTPAKP